MTDITAKLADALRRIKYHATALSDAQIIALQALEGYAEHRNKQHTEAQAGGTEGEPLIQQLRSLKVLLGTDSPEVRGWAPAVRAAAEKTVNAALRAQSNGALAAAAPAAAQEDVREQFEAKPAAFLWRYANGEEEFTLVDARTLDWDPTDDDCPAQSQLFDQAALDSAHEAGRQQGMSQANALWEMANNAAERKLYDDLQAKAEMAKAEHVAVPDGLARSDAEYWLQHRAAIIDAIQEAGFRIIMADGMFRLFSLYQAKAEQAAPDDHIPQVEDINAQHWTGMDGAIAFHLIERHAEDWSHAARLMHAWRDANLAPPATERRPLTDEQITSAWRQWPRQSITSAAKAIEFMRWCGITAGTTDGDAS